MKAIAVAMFVAGGLLLRADAATADSGPRLTDEELLRAADVAAIGHVQRVETGRDPVTNGIYTYITIELTDRLSGPVDGGTIVLKQLGGVLGGEALVVPGQASFAEGEDVLFFAEARPRDGSLYTASLWQGKWTIERDPATNARIAVRRAPGGADTGVFGGSERRDLAPFLQRIRAAAADLPARMSARADLDPDRSETRAAVRVASPYTLFDTPGRWNEFDTRTAIVVDIQAGGQPGLSGGGATEISSAAALWSAATPLVFSSGANATRCSNQVDGTGRITIVFMDPCAEISNSGSTLAIGGYYCLFSGGRTVNGVSFCRTTGGFVINNDSTNAVNFFATSACFQATETHEIGHALGLAHSTIVTAIMYPSISNNCRGGTVLLGADDLAGIRSIYPNDAATAPGTPSNLSATAAGATATLTWTAPATGGTPTGYIVEAGSSAGAANLANFNTGSVATTFSAGGVGAGTYFVRVRAANGAGTSAASNEATLVVGGCVAPGAPGGLAIASNSGGTVVLNWTAASGSPTTYIVEAGSSPGGTNLANSDLGSSATSLTAAGVGSGTYYVRVKARNACGTGAASNEVTLVVGGVR